MRKVLLFLLLSMAFPLLSQGEELQSTKPDSKFSPEDQALINSAKSIADNFISLFDRQQYERASKLSYLRESKNFQTKRKEKRPSISVSELESTDRYYLEFGKFITRELKDIRVKPTSVGMPDSKYVTFRYIAKFQKKDEQSQSITIKMEGDQYGKVVAFPWAF